MSKEFVATLITMITGFIAILAFLWAISSEIGEIKGELGVLSGMVKANSDGIAKLLDDARVEKGNTRPIPPNCGGHASPDGSRCR